MPTLLDKPQPLHRERTPARACRSCHAWLSSANEDHWCWACGGWTTQRLSALEALGSLAHGGKRGEKHRHPIGEALDDLISEEP